MAAISGCIPSGVKTSIFLVTSRHDRCRALKGNDIAVWLRVEQHKRIDERELSNEYGKLASLRGIAS
jgi:hypothetical protein